jgi:hypothetical protein
MANPNLPNGLLDYTIDIDGAEYNITAADSLHADVATQVDQPLKIKHSKLKSNVSVADDTAISELQEINNNYVVFTGETAKEVTIVPSSGGVFTDHIYVPDISEPDKESEAALSKYKKAAVNLSSLETIVSALKGFPILKWDGSSLDEDGDGNDAMEPFKVILYPNSAENSINNIPSNYYFLLVNTDTGYLRLGYPKNGGGSSYTELGVWYAKHTDQLGAGTGEDGKNYYTFSTLKALIEALDKADFDEAKTRAEQDNALLALIQANTRDINTNKVAITTLEPLSNIYGYAGIPSSTNTGSTTRKNIFRGTDTPVDTIGKEGDIYIRIS